MWLRSTKSWRHRLLRKNRLVLESPTGENRHNWDLFSPKLVREDKALLRTSMKALVFTILLAAIVASAPAQIINDPNADTITIVASDGVASEIGFPGTAIVTISDVSEPPPTNHVPFVRLDSPQNLQQFITPADVWLRAYAQDPEDGNDLIVEFFAGDHSLGFGTFVDVQCPNAPSDCPFYSLVWTNAPAGDYVITAKATDRAGASSVSDPAAITILTGVNIFATDPDATEVPATTGAAPDSARFTIRRASRSDSIVVYYQIGGTALNGIDYEKLSGEVSMPQGVSSVDIIVTPIDDTLFEETETIELTLIPPCPACLFANPPCELPQGTNCYPIGLKNKAVAFLHDNDPPLSNDLPVATIVAVDPIAVEGAFCPSNWWWTAPTATGGWTNNSTALPPCPGTNTALFEVRRHGPTNADLTVYYTIGGTATEGLDYKPLRNSGTVPSVVIPAGRYAARIQITPIDDTIPEGIETVVLVCCNSAGFTMIDLF
jgi:hypothetical protein